LLLKIKFNWGAYTIALLIATFNLLPTLALTKYTYYSPSLSDTMLMFPTLSQLIHSPWGYGVSLPGNGDGMSFALGFAAWVVLLAGVAVAIIRKDFTLRYLVGASASVLFFILPISAPLYPLLGLTAIIDFPWRLILCLVFATAWMGAVLSSKIQDLRIKWVIVSTVTVVLIIQSLPMAHTDKYWDKSLEWFAGETGDSYGEYAPLTRVTRDSAPFGKRVEFVNGEGTIETQVVKSNIQRYLIKSDDGGEIRINTAYFPGWELPQSCYITKRTLSHIDDSGLIGCKVDRGVQIIEIKFVAPPVQRVGNLITLAGIGTYLWILFRSYYPHTTSAKRSLKM
jgi:hypothetical protein